MKANHKTPVYFEIKSYLEAQFTRLNSEKITRWLMCFAENASGNIDDCRGNQITFGSNSYEGTKRNAYWNFMGPCLDDVIDEAFRRAVSLGEKIAPYATHAAYEETGILLREFVSRIYQRMVEIDQRLMTLERKTPCPEYDATELIEFLHESIKARVVSLKSHGPIGWRKSWARIKNDPVLAGALFGTGAILGKLVDWGIKRLQE